MAPVLMVKETNKRVEEMLVGDLQTWDFSYVTLATMDDQSVHNLATYI